MTIENGDLGRFMGRVEESLVNLHASISELKKNQAEIEKKINSMKELQSKQWMRLTMFLIIALGAGGGGGALWKMLVG